MPSALNLKIHGSISATDNTGHRTRQRSANRSAEFTTPVLAKRPVQRTALIYRLSFVLPSPLSHFNVKSSRGLDCNGGQSSHGTMTRPSWQAQAAQPRASSGRLIAASQVCGRLLHGNTTSLLTDWAHRCCLLSRGLAAPPSITSNNQSSFLM